MEHDELRFGFAPSGRLALLGENNHPLMIFKRDGTVEFNNAYTPDEAAEVFWQAVAKNDPLVKNYAWPVPDPVFDVHRERVTIMGETSGDNDGKPATASVPHEKPVRKKTKAQLAKDEQAARDAALAE